MKLLELHILQSFPVSCLNRDDVGAPKTAIFGGVNRARISSQCFKRAIRLTAKEMEKERPQKLFAGSRTLKANEDLAKEMESAQIANHELLAELICKRLVSKKAAAEAESEAEDDDDADDADTSGQTKTLLFLAPSELKAIAASIAKVDQMVRDKAIQAAPTETSASDKKARKEIKAALKKLVTATSKAVNECRGDDAADIAIFGRMVAAAADLTLEGAGMFNHALTTHKADNDVDFWTAVDDNPNRTHAGSANMGVAEHTSGVFYRYAAINLDQLFGEKGHLSHLTGEEVRKHIMETFIKATLLAMPSARDNSHNAHTEIGYALGFVRERGQPMQLVNAFEKPVRATGLNGLIEPSVRAMLLHLQTVRDDYGDLVKADHERAFGSHRPQSDEGDGQGGRTLKQVLSNSNLSVFCGDLATAAVNPAKPASA